MRPQVEPFREAISGHIDDIRDEYGHHDMHKVVSTTGYIYVLGKGPHDVDKHITLDLRPYRDASASARIHIKDVDKFFLFLSYLLY